MKRIYYVDISNVKYEQINTSLIHRKRLKKAEEFNDELKKVQSLTSYLLLRSIIKEYDIDINNYEFAYEENNKPFIKEINLNFNISHSKNIVCCIVSDVPVGLDCEYINDSRDISKLLNYCLSDIEYEEYLKLADNEKLHFFYQKWVMKEAYFKMNGKGLTKDFKNINLNYQTFLISDALNNLYYLSSSMLEATLETKEFNQINI